MDMNENWNKIPGYENYYEVSDMGNVRSLDRVTIDTKGRRQSFKGKQLKPRKNERGYDVVTLKVKGNKPKHIKIHQLVAMAFLDHKRCGHNVVVDHINEVKSDNRLCNLQLLSNKENVKKTHLKRKFLKYYGYTEQDFNTTDE